MSALFVAGAGTEVGKTYVTVLSLHALRAQGIAARAIKPVISGFDASHASTSDSALILDAMGEHLSHETLAEVSPWRYAAPLAPNMAARAEGKHVDFAEIVTWCRRQTGPILIEGIGGVMSPLSDRETNLDWIAALGAPVLLVGGTYLGAISHTLTALAVLHARSIRVPAIVLSESERSIGLDATADEVRRFAPACQIVALTRRPIKEIRLDEMAYLGAILRQGLAD